MVWVNLMFLSLILSGCYLSLSTASWLLSWVSMELMMMGFYFFVYMSRDLNNAEATMKYFLIQSLASTLILVPGFLFFRYSGAQVGVVECFLLMIFLKLGVFPFHGWVLPICYSFSYYGLFFVLGLLKLPPFWFLALVFTSFPSSSTALVLTFLMCTLSVGAMLGLLSSNVRVMLGASSIAHSGWVLLSIIYGGLFSYILSYLLTLAYVLIYLNKMEMSAGLALLSLSGIPPFVLFWGKVSVMWSLLENSVPTLCLIVIIFSTLISLIYYLKFSFFFYLTSQSVSFDHKVTLLIIFCLLGLGVLLI